MTFSLRAKHGKRIPVQLAGRGTHIRFVCVKGYVDWAMYSGPLVNHGKKVAADGDGTCCAQK